MCVCVCMRVCVCVCILSQILFHYSLLQDTAYSSLYYTVGSCCFSILYRVVSIYWDFPGGSHGNECKRLRFDPWVGKIPGEGNGSPLQYSGLENPMDRGACRATVHRVSEELDTTERLTLLLLLLLLCIC